MTEKTTNAQRPNNPTLKTDNQPLNASNPFGLNKSSKPLWFKQVISVMLKEIPKQATK